MKKLLLFILVLFGILSVQSLAGGCSAQICTCPNGGYVSYGEYCASYNSSSTSVPSVDYSLPRVWFAFSYDKTQKVYGIGEGESKKEAENESLQNCGTSGCKVIDSVKTAPNRLLIAISSNDVIVSKSFGNYQYNSDKRDIYYNDLLKKCRDKGGINCQIVFNSDYLLYRSRAYKQKFGY